MLEEGRIITKDWDLYDTRHVVFKTKGMSNNELEIGYIRAYKDFYKWNNIIKSSFSHPKTKHKLKHLFYTGGWKNLKSFGT
jgi:hypothetical protein